MNENKSGLCTASLVLGIISIVLCSFGFLPGLLGLIFAIVSLAKKKQPKGRAVGGLITSIIGIVLGFIVGVILIIVIVTSGIFVGGVAAGLKELEEGFESGNINVIDNLNNYPGIENPLDGDGYDFTGDNGWNVDDWNIDDWTTTTNNDGDFDWDSADWSDPQTIEDFLNSYNPDNVTNNNNSDDDSLMDFGLQVKFEDLSKFGYKYEYGDETYAVYSKNGNEYEFPAYTYEDYKEFGDSPFDVFNDYIDYMGIPDDPENYYDDHIWYYSSEWEYAIADQITQYENFEEYEIWLFAFNKNTDEMVILIGRPRNVADEDEYSDYVNDLISLMDYMSAETSF